MKEINDLYGWIRSTPSYRCSSHMDDMLDYLKTNFNISFFHYAKRFENGAYFELTTDRIWGLCYVTKYMTADTFISLKHLKNNIWVWGEGVVDKKEAEMHAERAEIYGIPQGISFIENAMETFSYSSNKIDDKNRINHLIKIRNEQLLGFEKDFIKSIEAVIKTYRADLKLPLSAPNGATLKKLSLKEATLVGFMAKGFKTCEIAKLMAVSEGTVKNKIEIIKEKLNCKTREQVIAICVERGYI